MKYRVFLDPVRKSLKKTPRVICHKVQIWADMIEKEGLPAVQATRGFRDHSLKGRHKGQRSVYLNKKWRLIYTMSKEHKLMIITVKEVIPHDY